MHRLALVRFNYCITLLTAFWSSAALAYSGCEQQCLLQQATCDCAPKLEVDLQKKLSLQSLPLADQFNTKNTQQISLNIAESIGGIVKTVGGAAGGLVTTATDVIKGAGDVAVKGGVIPLALIATLDSPQSPYIPGITDAVKVISGTNGSLEMMVQGGANTSIHIVQQAGKEAVKTVRQTAGDVTATYVKSWHDIFSQEKRSLDDATDAVKAAERFAGRQLGDTWEIVSSGPETVRRGRAIDEIWKLSVGPTQAGERNFAKATQESKVINQAAASTAAIYGGPAGAAAYAAWATYRATGDANQAWRAGLQSAILSQTGSLTGSLPTGTTGQILEKAAIAGAAGGIAIAAAGGDEKAISDAFLKSGGNVIIQGAMDQASAYSPNASDAIQTAQCISARDIGCLSHTRFAIKGRRGVQKYLLDKNAKLMVDSKKLDPVAYLGQWTGIKPNSPEGQVVAAVTSISKLPRTDYIPLLKNRYVLTSTFGSSSTVRGDRPSVILTYVGKSPPFDSTVRYQQHKFTSVAHQNPPTVQNPSTHHASRKSSQLLYVCPVGSIDRTIKVKMTDAGCDAIYRKIHEESQVIWHSDHNRSICVSKAADFAVKLKGMGIKCTIR